MSYLYSKLPETGVSPHIGTGGARPRRSVRNLVRAWTMELKDRRIRSNVLSPGPIKTPLVDRPIRPHQRKRKKRNAIK